MANNIFQKFQKLPIYFVAFFLAFVVFMGMAIVYAWTEPSSTPPAGNVSAPVNVGGTSQYKSGAFGVGGVFHGYSTGIFDGNVGIGTASPNHSLDVNGNINIPGTNQIIFNNEPTGWFLKARTTDNTDMMGGNLKNILVSGGGGSEGLAIKGASAYGFTYSAMEVQNNGRIYMRGNVGIGTTGPGAKLDIQTSNGADALKINTYKMVPISSTELGVYDSGNNQVLIFDQGN